MAKTACTEWALALLAGFIAWPAGAATFEMQQDPASTVLYISTTNLRDKSYLSYSVQGDGRAIVARSQPGESRPTEHETRIEAAVLTEIFKTVVDSGLTEWDAERVSEQVGLDPLGRGNRPKSETLAVFQFAKLTSKSGNCERCERWFRYADVAEMAVRFPALRELNGILQVLRMLDGATAGEPRTSQSVETPVFDLESDPSVVVIEVKSTGINTLRTGLLRVFGDGRGVVEEGFSNDSEPRNRWEIQLNPVQLERIEHSLIYNNLAYCDKSCIDAKMMRIQAGNRLHVEDGSRESYRFVLRNSKTGEQLIREISYENAQMYASRLPVVIELKGLANLSALVWEMLAVAKGGKK